MNLRVAELERLSEWTYANGNWKAEVRA